MTSFNLIRRPPLVTRTSDPWDSFFGSSLFPSFQQEFPASWPRVDIVEKPDAWEMHVDVPGCSKDDVSVQVKDKVVEISGQRKHEIREEDQEKNLRRVERSFGSFKRSFTLPESVDDSLVEAKLLNGVLEVKIPKREPVQPEPRSIPISSL